MATVTITVAQGKGNVYVYRNGLQIGIFTYKDINKAFYFEKGDSFKFEADNIKISDTESYHFRQFCDPTIGIGGRCVTTNPLTGTITANVGFIQVYWLQDGKHYKCVNGACIEGTSSDYTLSLRDCQVVCGITKAYKCGKDWLGQNSCNEDSKCKAPDTCYDNPECNNACPKGANSLYWILIWMLVIVIGLALIAPELLKNTPLSIVRTYVKKVL